ncbi:MAG: serine hydrolase, partial [Alphaproteobacteria bacterium]|nr:serine hydrolase [Alphaproteobacteria bacterium]
MHRRTVFMSVVALVLAGGIAPAGAQPPSSAPTIDAFDRTFRDWMQEHGVARGMLAVGWQRRLVFERGYGGFDPAARVLLASLSKAITGRCVAALVLDGRLRLDSTVGEVLAPFFRQHGAPDDPRLKDATVAQLLVHRAGFAAAPRDLMTPAAIELLQRTRSPASASPAELLAATLSAPLAAAPGTAFAYSNIGYLTLGVMIETVTGESYERFCARTVLEPAGIAEPSLDPAWRAFSSFGGWQLSGAEYLAFLTTDRIADTLAAAPAAGDADAARAARAAALRELLLDTQHRQTADGGPTGWTPVWYGLGQFAARVAPQTGAG